MTRSPALSIVHVTAPAPYGGLESVVTTLARGQIAAGDETIVAAVIEPDEVPHPLVQALRAADVPCRPIQVGPRGYLTERRSVRSLLRDVSADVLHTHGYRPDVVDAPVARRLGIATVTTVHGFASTSGRGRIYEWLQRRSFRRLDAVVTVSNALRADLTAFGVPTNRIHLVQNAWEAPQTPFDRARARSELGIPSGEVAVGWVGRMSAEKGPDVMVRALGLCGDPGVTLSMVGTGPMEAKLRALAGAQGVEERIRWHGLVPGAGRYLKAFDAVVLTSWTEGTPMILLEAMAAEVPVVTTAVGGVPDVVSSSEAVLVSAGDEPALAAALRDVAASTPASRERARAAKRRLEEDFAVAPWVRRYREIYLACVGRRI